MGKNKKKKKDSTCQKSEEKKFAGGKTLTLSSEGKEKKEKACRKNADEMRVQGKSDAAEEGIPSRKRNRAADVDTVGNVKSHSKRRLEDSATDAPSSPKNRFKVKKRKDKKVKQSKDKK